MPRWTTSSASSRGVQCGTGRPDWSGGSQATARIRAIGSAVNLPPHPARGKSPSTSSTASRNAEGFSTHSITTNRSNAFFQRFRQMPTPCRSQPRLGDRFVLEAFKGEQDDLGPMGEPLRTRTGPDHRSQDFLLMFGDHHLGGHPWHDLSSKWTCEDRRRWQRSSSVGRPIQPECTILSIRWSDTSWP